MHEGGRNCLKYLRDCSYGGDLAWLGRLARLGEMIFIPYSYWIFYLSSIRKFVMSLKKRLFVQVVFTINVDVKPLYRTNVLIFYPAVPGWPTCACSYGKFSSRLGEISAKSSEISPRWAGSLLIWTYYIFIRVSLRKVRSHFEPAHLHMNSPLKGGGAEIRGGEIEILKNEGATSWVKEWVC